MGRPPRCCRPGGTQIPGTGPHDLPLQGEAPAVESFLLFWETSRPERTQSLGKQYSQPRAPEPRSPHSANHGPSLPGKPEGRQGPRGVRNAPSSSAVLAQALLLSTCVRDALQSSSSWPLSCAWQGRSLQRAKRSNYFRGVGQDSASTEVVTRRNLTCNSVSSIMHP